MYRRVALLLAIVACEATAPAVEPPPPRWVYPPASTAWPLGELRGRIGRSQAPQHAPLLGIIGEQRAPLRSPTPWEVPGDGAARAVIYGFEGIKPAIEVIDVDAGRVAWRDTTTCPGPIVGVTSDAIVCADASGVRGVTLDGKAAWRSEAPFVAMTGERVVVGPTGEAVILEADTGEELSRVKLPANVIAETIIASCGDVGRELFAIGTDNKLVRITEAKGVAVIAWSVLVEPVETIDACDGDHVIAKTGASLIAFARATGKQTGRIDGVRGWWPARDGSARIEVSTVAGVTRRSRDLAAGGEVDELPPLGELLSRRGDRRLIRATSMTAVVLDREGVAAFIPLTAMGAVLGDAAIVAGSWNGSQAEAVRRSGLPARYPRALRIPRRGVGVSVPAELRDLPAVVPASLDRAIPKVDTGKHGVTAVAVDPEASGIVYAVALEAPTTDDVPTSIAAIDLVAGAWIWQRSDACGPGAPVAIAVARDIVACGARGSKAGMATVRGTSRDGAARWEWQGDAVDTVQAAGDTVLVASADRLFVLDAASGRARARLTSDDGAAVRAAVVEHTGATIVVGFERGRLVARSPRLDMNPLWSLAVDGIVRAIAPSHDGVLVELDDGDAWRIDARTGSAIALPGLGLAWRATGELVTGSTPGGPIPGEPLPPPPRPLVQRTAQGKPLEDPERPRLWTPVPQPPSLGESWQYTLFELTGGVRARNDYAITGQVLPAPARGPAGSLLAVVYGPSAREVLVVDPRTGDPLRRVALPEDAPTHVVFSTIVNGSPVAGTVLAQPLRVVLF